MCGILGSVYRDRCDAASSGNRRALAYHMAREVSHRGPDDIQVAASDPAYLACNRLTIVGGPDGRQPLTNEDRTIFVICNGEIFNYQELQGWLIKQGHVFLTSSDCESIVHLYEEVGLEAAKYLCGQFSCAIWDSVQQRLLLMRDRFGICPLFWTIQNDRFHFASEIKAIFQDPLILRRIEVGALAEVALLYSSISPRSCFTDIWQVPAANQLVLDFATWNIEVKPYWLPPLQSRHQSGGAEAAEPGPLADQLRQELQSAVRCRLQGDSPVGAYLSGGLDSATVACLAQAEGVDTVFSITFPNKQFDESSFQAAVTKSLRLKWHAIDCSASMILDALIRATWHAESPLFRTAPIPMMLLSERVHEIGYKVILTGEGADELFFGYPDFLRFQVQQIFAQGTDSKKITRQLEVLFRRSITDQEVEELYQKYLGGEALIDAFPYHSTRWNRTSRLLRLFSPEHDPATSFKRILGKLQESVTAAYPKWHELTPLAYAQLVEIQTKLSGYLLAAQGDRMAMANAVEQRFPYLDERVVKFALELPESMRLRGETAKYILRYAMQKRLPDVIVERPKQGYLAPNDDPIQLVTPKGHKLFNELLSDAVVRRMGYFEPAQVRQALVQAQQRGNDGTYVDSTIVYVLSTHLLHLMFVEGVAWQALIN